MAKSDTDTADDDDVEVVMLRGPGAKKFLASLSPSDDGDDGDDGDDDTDDDEKPKRRASDKKAGTGFKYFGR